MKQLFHIENSYDDKSPQVFCLRIGEHYAVCCLAGNKGNELYRLDYYETSEWNHLSLSQLLALYPEATDSFPQILICYDFPQIVMTPADLYTEEKANLFITAAHGTMPSYQIAGDNVSSQSIYTVYAVPANLHEELKRQFPDAAYRHGFSLDTERVCRESSEGLIDVNFRTDDFTVAVARNGSLLLVQTFPYAVPEDVVYYLLKLCKQFDLSQQTVQLRLSGLVDKQSALFNELYQYFVIVQFREAAWANAGSDYPAHFFTSLNDLARCVS